jgi:hypothetical protein
MSVAEHLEHAPLTGPDVWMGETAQASEAWVHCFSEAEITEIDAAYRHARAAGATLGSLTRDAFPLPEIGKVLAKVQHELEDGWGLYLLRGIPVERYSKDELRFIYWGLGLHLGTAVSQSKRGDVLGDVRDLGTGLDGPKFRGYTSAGELTYHADAADVTGLFCLQPAKRGGLSRMVSTSAIHNEILRTRPDLLEVLYQPYYWSFQGNELPGTPPHYEQPVFTMHKGKFAARYTRTHMRSAQMMDRLPKMTEAQAEALDLIDELCARPEFQLTMMFQPGDIQFLNNHLMLHMRTEFEDYPEPERRRHLMRLWLSLPNGRELSPAFAPFYRDTRAGAVRGGHPGHGDEIVFETA